MGKISTFIGSVEYALKKEMEDRYFTSLFAREKEAVIRRGAATTANVEPKEGTAFSIDKMIETVESIEIPPDPLNGAKILVYSSADGFRDAQTINRARSGDNFMFTGLAMEFNPAVPEDQIWCMDGDRKIVKVIRVGQGQTNHIA